MGNRKILVTGSDGLLGTALRKIAPQSSFEFQFVTRQDADLRDAKAVQKLMEKYRPDCVVHTAAVVGGIKFNLDEPEIIKAENEAINENVLRASLILKIPKVVSYLSTCIFPVDAVEPWQEPMVHLGEVDRRHWGYAQAKRKLDLLSKELTSESKGQSCFVTLMPATMYGAGDNYNLMKSHVLSACLLKIFQAQKSGEKAVFWGSGNPRREFVLSDDVAKITLWAIEHYIDSETLILSPSSDLSVRELVEAISAKLEYSGGVDWDLNQPDGRLSRQTSAKKFHFLCKDFKFTPFLDGLSFMIDDFKKNFPDIRGFDGHN